ncbi:MAG: tripartite tricarboxylate transporter TctB family protein [Petrotogales bacterium]
MNYKNIIYGIILIVLSVVVIFLSMNFPSYVVRGKELPGPKFFPQVISGALIIIGIYEIGLGIYQTKKKKEKLGNIEKEKEVEKETGITKRGIINIVVVFAGIILFIPFIEIVGFKLGAFILATVLMIVLGMGIIKSLIYSAVLTAVILIIFDYLFRIPFPEGMFFSF